MRPAVAVFGAARRVAWLARDAGLLPLAFPLDDGQREAFRADGIETASASSEFFERLEHPRVHLLDLPAGGAVDELIDAAYVTMEPGDVVLDASGSYWGDTLRRWRRMRHRAIFYVDIAFLPATQGQDILVGGEPRGVAAARPTLDGLAHGGRAVLCGGPGAAHFALQARDAFHIAMAHARGEVQQLLEAWPGAIDSGAVLGCVTSPAEPGPRAGWVLDDALHMQAALPLLAQAVMLEQARLLDEHEPPTLPGRVGGFVRPEDLG